MSYYYPNGELRPGQVDFVQLVQYLLFLVQVMWIAVRHIFLFNQTTQYPAVAFMVLLVK